MLSSPLSPIFDVAKKEPAPKLPISRLEGEMSGRTERGAVEHQPWRLAFLATALAALLPTPAFAHASDRGHVLLLPTGYYIVGGALAVAVSFLVLAMLPPAALDNFWRKRLPLFALGDSPRTIISLISFAGFALLIAAGIFGSRDPLSNPLPLVVWRLSSRAGQHPTRNLQRKTASFRLPTPDLAASADMLPRSHPG